MIPPPQYGTPTPLTKDEVEKLTRLNEAIWTRSTDRFGLVHSFPKDNKALPKEDLNYVLWLIGSHVLPCALRSGPYGELSVAVFDHSVMPDIPPTRVISLSEEHFGIKDLTFERWQDRFNEISQLTHSSRNRQVLAFYKFPEPGPASDYSY